MNEFLKGLGLEEETLNKIMAKYGELVNGIKSENETLKTQIDDANNEIKSYKDMDIEGIKTKATEWETKYNNLVNEQEEAKKKGILEERTNAFFNDVKFASESAKAGVIAQFNAKEFKYDEETQKFQGASEWLNDLKEKDTGAFLSDVANPRFTTNPTAPTASATADELREAMGLGPKK